ncbi:hypothetical protein BKA70DRAFT_1238790 [Coprinopsis sp. MPI-PUGE-AT-0042]|nr:hypothetical protein BKA70DRAFT_1238790 [Coprinopsis sp. MPI-PUGE-AT-0042]
MQLPILISCFFAFMAGVQAAPLDVPAKAIEVAQAQARAISDHANHPARAIQQTPPTPAPNAVADILAIQESGAEPVEEITGLAAMVGKRENQRRHKHHHIGDAPGSANDAIEGVANVVDGVLGGLEGHRGGILSLRNTLESLAAPVEAPKVETPDVGVKHPIIN